MRITTFYNKADGFGYVCDKSLTLRVFHAILT